MYQENIYIRKRIYVSRSSKYMYHVRNICIRKIYISESSYMYREVRNIYIRNNTQTAVINIINLRIIFKLDVSYASQHTFSKVTVTNFWQLFIYGSDKGSGISVPDPLSLSHINSCQKFVTVTFENVCWLAYETSSLNIMRKFIMFITAVCVLFLIKLRWPNNKSLYVLGSENIYIRKSDTCKPAATYSPR